jgi:hypothetical protein
MTPAATHGQRGSATKIHAPATSNSGNKQQVAWASSTSNVEERSPGELVDRD